jgi:FkbM family methyltransferase
MKPRLITRLRAIVTWPPLNRPLTGALRAMLPERVRRHPAVARYAPRTGEVTARLPDGGLLRMFSLGDDDVASAIFWRGWAGHEPETARRFYELARSAPVTLDIGAHVGYFALLAARANPDGRVYAFEPLARVRERLARNIALNAAANVTCVPLAVGSPAGTAEFFHVKEGIPSSSSLSQRFMQSIVSRDALTSSTVEVVEVDGFVEARRIAGVALVKIDTETTEAAVFRGMLRTLRRDRPSIVCEVLDADVADAVEALIAPLDYAFFMLTDGAPRRCAHIVADARWRNFMFVPAERAAAFADDARAARASSIAPRAAV